MNANPTHDIVIFGAAGDLALRKLIPALYMAHAHKTLNLNSRIVCVGRNSWTSDEYAKYVTSLSPTFIGKNFNQETWAVFIERVDFIRVDATNVKDYENLKQTTSTEKGRIYYLSTAPSLFAEICSNLSEAKLISPMDRVVLEKPLGKDLASSREINDAVGRHFREEQIYRIDHYLGKETVQNLMVLRFGNSIFEPIWRSPYIRSVQITVAETVGVGSRAGFYDQTGAARDMVQNHLLQLLCIVAMEQPISLGADDIRDEKLRVLRCLKPMNVAEIKTNTVRGQYSDGTIGNEVVPSYVMEDGIPTDSKTETFVALKAYINNARWANVPFYLRTGKRMQTQRSEIIIEFSEQPFSIFSGQANGRTNRLVITLQPDERIQMQMMAKEPGSGMNMKPVQLDLNLNASLQGRRAEAYERLLMDVTKGRLTHFMRRDELEAAWEWIEPILNAWESLGDSPRSYKAGTWGPAASSALIAREGLTWFEET
jgi:glucose-6-phosphate 1-dehydrogenase